MTGNDARAPFKANTGWRSGEYLIDRYLSSNGWINKAMDAYMLSNGYKCLKTGMLYQKFMKIGVATTDAMYYKIVVINH